MKKLLFAAALLLAALPAQAQDYYKGPGPFTINVPAIVTTSTDGMSLVNPTAATVGVPVQISPRLRFRGNAWNTTPTAASNTSDVWLEAVPLTGSTVVSQLRLGAQDNGGTAYFPMTVGAFPTTNTFSAQWFGVTPSTTNYAFLGKNDGSETILNTGTGQVEIRAANVTHFAVGPNGININGPSNSAPAVPVTITNAANSVTLFTMADSGATTLTGPFAFGTNPAASGAIRMPNGSANGAITYRNAANNGDINVLFLDGSNLVNLNGTNFRIGNAGNVAGVNNVSTSGAFGVSTVVAQANISAQTTAATIASYAGSSSDADYDIRAQMSVTASTTLTTNITCTYTDVSNTSRAMIMPVAPLSGTFTAAGAITGAGASIWSTPTMHIRAKASTSITCATTAGTFTSVTYSASAVITELN